MSIKGVSAPVTCGHADRRHKAFGMCHSCYSLAWYHKSDKAKHNKRVRDYTRTRRGYVVNAYHNLKSRCLGYHDQSYKGLPYCTREEFYAWARSPLFDSLYSAWQASGRMLTRAPSVNRIDSSKGYTLDNIEWLTLAENCALAGKGRAA